MDFSRERKWSGPAGQGHPRGRRSRDGQRAPFPGLTVCVWYTVGVEGVQNIARGIWYVRYGQDAGRCRRRRPPMHDMEVFEASKPHRILPWVAHGTYGHGGSRTMGSALESTLMPQQGIGGGTQEGWGWVWGSHLNMNRVALQADRVADGGGGGVPTPHQLIHLRSHQPGTCPIQLPWPKGSGNDQLRIGGGCWGYLRRVALWTF